MKYQILFSGENKKYFKMSSAENFAHEAKRKCRYKQQQELKGSLPISITSDSVGL